MSRVVEVGRVGQVQGREGRVGKELRTSKDCVRDAQVSAPACACALEALLRC